MSETGVPSSDAGKALSAPGEPDQKTSLLRVRAIAPRERPGASARVEVRDSSGARVALLELSAVAPRAELACEPGEYELALESTSPPALGALPQRIVLFAGATGSVEFVLSALWRLSGRLTDERGLGLADVPVALEREQRAVSEIRTLPDGGFVFPPLPEGDYALVLGDPLGPLVPRRILRLDGELGALEVRVPVLLELAVQVLDEQGLAVAGAEVEGVGEKGGRVAGVTDADGRLRATRLPPGNYRIFARHPTLGRGNRVLALEEPKSAPLEIRLLTAPPPR